jgi:hypothetical protein
VITAIALDVLQFCLSKYQHSILPLSYTRAWHWLINLRLINLRLKP